MSVIEHTFDIDETLRQVKEKQVGLVWPIPVDDRLDGLVARATTAGERTNRRELLAALVATCDLNGDEIGQALRSYRRMKVRDVVLRDLASDVDVVRIADHRPGPRRTSS